MKILFKILGIGALALMVLIGTSAVYDAYFPWEDKARERAFNRKLEQKMAAGDSKIYLKDLTDFEWEKVCYFETQNEEGGMNYPTPSQVLGREYSGYIPSQSCDTFGHKDLLFFNKTTARFIRNKMCLSENKCRTDSFHTNLHCCSRGAFFEEKVQTWSNTKNTYTTYDLNEVSLQGEKL